MAKSESVLSGGRLKRLSVFMVVCAIAVFLVFGGYSACFTYVLPDEFAIKESRFGDGIIPGVNQGGHVYFTAPGVTYHRFPRTWQVLDFNHFAYEKHLEGHIPGYDGEGTLEIPSSDGFLNRFEVTILYRITDPSIVIDKDKGVGKGDLFKQFVKTKADPALKKALGQMAAEQLYDVDIRQKHATEAQKFLNDDLNPVGIEVGEVLIRQFKYMPEYETKISAKVLQRQLEIANRHQALAEQMHAEVRKITAEGQAAVEVEKNRADKERRVIRAEADLYARQKEAAGDLLEKQAQAQGQLLVNKAYEGAGADRLVGIEMAKKATAIKKIYIKSCRADGMNPLDLRDMLNKLSGR